MTDTMYPVSALGASGTILMMKKYDMICYKIQGITCFLLFVIHLRL